MDYARALNAPVLKMVRLALGYTYVPYYSGLWHMFLITLDYGRVPVFCFVEGLLTVLYHKRLPRNS